MQVLKNLEKQLSERLQEKAPRIQVLLGPRQVGKTTFIEQFMKNHGRTEFHYHTGDGIHDPHWIQLQWQEATQLNKILIIDEIQKIPNWSEQIKKCWDASLAKKEKMKCILLGSSSLTLNRGLSESLTGRFEQLSCHHWNLSQTLKLKKMSLEDFLIYGGYPGSYEYLKKENRWQGYIRSSIVETVIAKDILMQAKVKSPALFRQCFYVLANYPAQVISYNKILGQLQDKGNIDLTKYYIELYEGAYLFKAIHKYSKNEVSKRQSSPKIISLSPSLNTFHRMDNLTTDYMGRVFESLVGAQLLKVKEDIYYWSEGDYEVDFVFEYRGKIIAIEVKSGRSRRSASLDKFMQKYPTAKVIFVTKENYHLFEADPLKFIADKI